MNVGYLGISDTLDIVPSNKYVRKVRKCDLDKNERDAILVGYLDYSVTVNHKRCVEFGFL